MKRKEIDFKGFIQEDEEFLSLPDNVDTLALDMVEPISEIEPEEQESTNGKNGRFLYDQFRLLYPYFSDMSHEPLLTKKGEIEISAKIKKCEEKTGEIKAILERLLAEKDTKSKRDGNRIAREKRLSRQNNILNALMKAYSGTGSRLKERFIKANLRLVVSIAKRHVNMGLAFADLIQEGNLGLMRAVDRFDHKKGCKFSTYSVWWILQALSRSLMDRTRTIKIPVYLQEQTSKVFNVISMLHKELGRKPILEEIAKKLNYSVKFVQLVLNAEKEVISLDSPIQEGDQKTYLDLIADEAIPSPDSLSDDEKLKGQISQALSLLTPREQEIIRLRYGIDQEDIFTLDVVGKMYGLTRERIRQIEKAALGKIAKSDMGEILESFLR